jgi:hypothetical protein
VVIIDGVTCRADAVQWWVDERDASDSAGDQQPQRLDRPAGANNDAAEIVCDAERRMGVMLAEMERQAVGRPAEKRFHDGSISPPTLSDLGISKQLSHRWQDVGRLPEDDCQLGPPGA